MNSLRYSMQETPSSFSHMNITHTTTDELDSILREIESHSLETLLLKSDRRANIFTASQANSERAKSRVLELPKTLSDPLDALNEKISALNSAMAEKEKELALLENRDHKLHEQVQRSYATVEKLKERKYLGRALLEATRENSDVIDAGSATIRRIEERRKCDYPARKSETSESQSL